MNQTITPSALSAASPGILTPKSSLRFWRNFMVSSMLLFASLLPNLSKAQTSLTIGTGGTTNTYYPIYTFYGYNYSQSTFLASEIVAAGATSGTPGYISSISYNCSTYYSAFTTLCKDWVVYMGNTTKSTFSSTTDWVALGSLTKVFDGTVLPSGTGWYKITFPTPFYWDGTSNLVVAVDENTPSYTSTMNWVSTSRTGTRSISYYNDGTNPNPASPPTANTSGAVTPDIKIDYTPAVPCSGTTVGGSTAASATSLCPGDNVTLSVSGATVGTGMTWQWESATAATGPWSTISGATSTNLTLAPPSGTTTYYRRQTTCTSTSSSAYSSGVAVSVSTSMSVPYSENFEAGSVGVNVPCATASPSFSSGVTTYYGTDYWKIISDVTVPYAAASRPGGSKYLVAGYYIGTYTGAGADYWFTPGINLSSGKTYRFSYWHRMSDYSASSYAGGVDIGMYYSSVASKSSTTLTAIKPDLLSRSNNTYQQNVGDFSVPSSGVYYLAIKANNKTFGGYYCAASFDDLNLIELPACSTATASTFGRGGTASATPNVLCGVPGTTALSVSGSPAFSGLSFQWSVATGSPTTFTDIVGATTAAYSYPISTGGNYYFRCLVTCAATGLSSYSDTTLVKTTPITPPYIEDFETAPIPNNVPCAGFTYSWGSPGYYWSTATAGSPGASVVNHTVGGSKVLLAGTYLGTYGSSADQWWFTPGLALTAGKAYDVSFWFRSAAYTSSYYSYPYKVGIGVGGSQTALAMANLGDTTCDGTGTISTWFKFKRGFVATATATQYVGIKINHSNFSYYGTNIDDIGVEQLPPCSAKPTAGTAMASPSTLCTSTATSLISLTGLSAASDLQFQWEESTTGLPGSFTPISGATAPGYTTTTPATAKWYRCVVTCPLISAPNVDTSAAVFVKTTPITPPYYEDFETGVMGVNMPCASYTTSWGATTYWYLRDGDFSTSYPAIKNHTPGGSKYIHAGYALGSYSSGKTEYWFTPALALTASKAYNVSYWFNGSGYSGGNTLTGVAAGTAQSIAAMTIPAGADTILNISTYRQINRAFIAPTTGNYYVGIKVNNLVYSYPGVAIDDIGVTQLPPCSAKPTAGTATCTPTMVCTTGSVLLGLVGTSYASDLTFQWYNVTTGTPVIIAGATRATYSTPTLSATQKYICVVSCPLISAPNTDTSAAITVNVGAITPPYKETFESGTIGTNLPCASYTYSWGSPGTYWTLAGAAFSSSYPAIINHTPGGSKYLHAGYYIGTYGSGAVQYWFTPAIKFTAGATYEMSYWYNGSGYAGGNVNLGMYYGTAQTAAAMTTAIIPDLTGINTSTYKQLTGRFIAPATGGYFVGIRVNNSTYNYPGVAIDDIGLDQLPPCSGVPTAGAVTAPSMLCTPGTVAVNMDYAGVTKASGLSYRWEWSTSPTFATISGSSAALTGPSYTSPTISSTTYFRCIVKCTLTGDSTFSSVLKVDVGAIVPPYVEDFEKATPGVNVPCASYSTSPYWGQYYYWNTMSSPMTYGTSPLDNHTVGGSKYLIGGYYIGYSSYSGYSEDFWLSPAVTLTAGKRYQVSYWYNTDGYSGANYKCGMYMGTTQTKAGMTTLLGSILNPSNTTYKEFKHQFVASASGNVYFGIMKGSAGFGYGMSFDDIGVREVPPCSSSVVAGTIFSDPEHICSAGGTTTLDLSGSTLATGLTYEWLSSTTAAGPYTSTGGTTLPYNTDPLFAATWFKCVVKCSATGVADTSAAFRVGVGGFDLPYIEDFEKRADFPLCSDATAKGMYYYDAWKVYVGTYTGAYTNHTPGGNKHLVAGYYLGYSTYSPSYPTVTDDNYWFTPGLNLRAGYKYNLSFWYIGTGGGSYSVGNRMGVYYGRTQSVGGMTNVIAPFKVRTNSSYEQLDTNFTVSTSAVYYLGFRKSNNIAMGSSYALQAYGVAFDDINLNYAPCAGTPFAGTISSAKPSGTAYCAYTPITLTDIGATISLVPGIKYQWYRRSSGSTGAWSTVVGAKDTVLSADTLIGYDYKLAVICSNTNDTVYSPLFQVPALPPHPAVTISPTTTPVTYCLGDSIKFTATSFTGALYDWMLDSAIVPGWKFNDYGATEPGTVMVRVTSALSACPAWSNQVKMIVNDPGYSVSITKPSDSIICAGTSMLLSATSSKAGVTYQWRKNNVDIPGATSSTYLVTTGGAYRVMAHDGLSSCKAASRNITITVKPNPPAVLSLPGGTATACENEGVQLNANTGGFSYEWTRGGSTIFGWKDSAVIVKNSGVYAVKVRSSDGCVSTSSSITVNILPSPIPVITKSGLTLGTVGTYASYQWIRNGVDIAGSTSSTHSLVYKGYYKVRVKDGNGCEGESNPIEITDAGLQDNPTSIGTIGMVNDQIKLYPNPTMAKVYIESPIAVKVSVKDVTGKTVYESRETKEVDLSKYADGVYLFTISDKEGNELIKQQRVTKFSK